ncbi:MAG: hypothetical protein QNI91_03055 [Arenicellales bacterium]|nr:hypothetical protein [Arenicellales bacterium]
MSLRSLGAVILSCTLGSLGISSASYAELYPRHHPVPGGIAVVGLDISSEEDVTARFGRTRILTIEDRGFWYAIVGIELDAAQGDYLITANTSSEDPIIREFRVGPHRYPLRVKRNHTAKPGPLVTPGTWRPELDAAFPLLPPVTASKVVPFGTRYANGDETGPEQCTVFHLDSSLDVVAPGQGIVADIFTNEEAEVSQVTIDHGMGLYSSVGPIKQLRKEKGTVVERGEVLGKFEYHKTLSRDVCWKTTLNGAVVNPFLFTEQQ